MRNKVSVCINVCECTYEGSTFHSCMMKKNENKQCNQIGKNKVKTSIRLNEMRNNIKNKVNNNWNNNINNEINNKI